MVVNDVASTREALLARGYEPAPVKEFKRGASCWRAIFSFKIPTATRSKCWSGTATISDRAESEQLRIDIADLAAWFASLVIEAKPAR